MLQLDDKAEPLQMQMQAIVWKNEFGDCGITIANQQMKQTLLSINVNKLHNVVTNWMC